MTLASSALGHICVVGNMAMWTGESICLFGVGLMRRWVNILFRVGISIRCEVHFVGVRISVYAYSTRSECAYVALDMLMRMCIWASVASVIISEEWMNLSKVLKVLDEKNSFLMSFDKSALRLMWIKEIGLLNAFGLCVREKWRQVFCICPNGENCHGQILRANWS